MNERDYKEDMLVVALTAVAYLVVWPVGDYLVGDEWAFVKSLEYLVRQGRLVILDWNPMSLLGLHAWGGLWALLFGLTPTVVRTSMTVAAAVEALLLLRILRWGGISAGWRLAATVGLLFNPLHLFHCFQYATDIATSACMLASMYAYGRSFGVEGGARTGFWLAGAAAASVALLMRQFGILASVGFGCYLLLFERRTLASVRVWLAAFALPIATFLAFTGWYQLVHGPTYTFVYSKAQILRSLAAPSMVDVVQVCFILVYVGWFVLPLAVGARWPASRPGVAWRAAAVGFVAVLVFMGFAGGWSFPYLLNKVTPYGFFESSELVLGDRPVLYGRVASVALSIVFAASVLWFGALTVTTPWPDATSFRGRWDFAGSLRAGTGSPREDERSGPGRRRLCLRRLALLRTVPGAAVPERRGRAVVGRPDSSRHPAALRRHPDADGDLRGGGCLAPPATLQ